MRELSHLPAVSPISGASYSAVELSEDASRVWMLDQRKLPDEETYQELESGRQVAEGIRDMVIRGAPAIGIAAAYGMVLDAQRLSGGAKPFLNSMNQSAEMLRCTRPTAVNLQWGIDVMMAEAEQVAGRDPSARVRALADRARLVHQDDVAACKAMGREGAKSLEDGATVLTHCNAGALATGGYGTALGVIRAAIEDGKRIRVLADETRPYLQGMRLTAWELARDGIEVEIICDNAAASFMARGAIDAVVVGADRIARNGDVANKIGTYGLACLADVHQVPFYVAAPWSTMDLTCASGEAIPIELRDSTEVTVVAHKQMAPAGVHARYPAFDVTPARLISAIFTERGALRAPSSAAIAALVRSAS